MTQILNEAIKNNQIISISYVDKKGNRSERKVEPYEIKGGKLYAYCLEKNSIRAFIITAISSPVATGEKFTPRF